MEGRSTLKLSQIGKNMWILCSGLIGDGRRVVQMVRGFCTDFRTKFGTGPTIQSTCKALAAIQHRATLRGDGRPFGVDAMVVGFDKDNSPRLHVSRTSGRVTRWRASAIGQHADRALDMLAERLNIGEDSCMTTREMTPPPNHSDN